jgi:uncharacterized protein YllA (UPF0747 family)
MESSCIPQTRLPGTSRLFADYTTRFDRLARFYAHDPFDPGSLSRAAQAIDFPADRRSAIVKALRAQNGGSPALDLLAQPGTVAVVTGQQVGFFGGPLYTVFKALSAARLARELTERGQPAAAVFWLATEDHDFEEIHRAWVFNPQREPLPLDVMATPDGPEPVGRIWISQVPLDGLRSALTGFPFADEAIALAERAYQPGRTLGEAFHAFVRELLAPLGLLLLDPLDPAVRAIGAPFLEGVQARAPEIRKMLAERSRELEAAGYHAQVLVDTDSTLLFSLAGGHRQPLKKAVSGDLISPNALLRPVFQDYLLPTVAYFGGPAEVAYLAQSHVLYDELLGRMPVVYPRAGFTLLDARTHKLLARYGLDVLDVCVHPDKLRDRVAAALVPEEVHRSLDETAGEIAARLDRLAGTLETFDPSLAKSLGRSRAKILYQLGKIQHKTARETLRRDARARAEAEYLIGALYPHRHLQERFYSVLPFLAEHGFGLIPRLLDAVQLACPDHQVLRLS